MAATAWVVYNKAIKKIGNGTIDLSSLTDEVASGNGYTASGKAMTSEVWTVGGSAGAYKFDAADVVWTATGGAINSIKAAVILTSGDSAGACHLLAWSQLTTAAFNLSSGNTLTVQLNASGIFTLANA